MPDWLKLLILGGLALAVVLWVMSMAKYFISRWMQDARFNACQRCEKLGVKAAGALLGCDGEPAEIVASAYAEKFYGGFREEIAAVVAAEGFANHEIRASEYKGQQRLATIDSRARALQDYPPHKRDKAVRAIASHPPDFRAEWLEAVDRLDAPERDQWLRDIQAAMDESRSSGPDAFG